MYFKHQKYKYSTSRKTDMLSCMQILDFPEVSMCEQHFNVVAGWVGVSFNYFIYC